MKKIYFYVPEFGDYNLLSDSAPAYNNGYYKVYDILGREFYFPISSSVIISENWNGDMTELEKYKDVLEEMKGIDTGVKEIKK